MRVWPVVLVAALAAASCAHNPSDSSGGSGGSAAGSGGSSAGSGGSTSSGSGGTVTSNTGGSPSGSGGVAAGSGGTPAGTGGGTSPGTGGSTPAGTGGGGAGDAGSDQASVPTPPTGGKALLVVGTIPIVGTDVKFEEALKKAGLEVEIVQEKMATPATAAGKRIVILSYSMSSPAFNAEAYADVAVPMILTEQNLLPRLKMSTGHGFTPSNLTKITIINADHELAGGHPKGDVEVYMRQQEMFWGTPPETAIKIAHITNAPEKITYFAYEKGAMMVGIPAPAKRVQFFHATHSPDPVDKNLYLNEAGLKLLDISIAWCLK